MSAAHAMSDDQVASELKKMTAFIRQEAFEKAREIQLKADEEFAIEKSRIVRTETASIDTSYQKKFKTASMSQQITRSTVSNKSRLRLLGARQELLDTLFEEARGRLGEFSGDNKDSKASKEGAADYQTILKGLILQGLYALNEKKILVRARQKDFSVAKKAAADAAKEYQDNIQKGEISVEVDEKNPLPEDSKGGVSIANGTGRIDINNTLEERLKLLQTDALPQIRTILFGENENRKFKD